MEQIYDYSEFKEPINCQYTTSLQAGNINFHMHNSYEIYLLLDGKIHYFVDQTCYRLTGGNVIIFTSQEIHKATNLLNSPFRRMVLHIDPAFVMKLCTPQTNLLQCFLNRETGCDNVAMLNKHRMEEFQYLYRQIHALCENRQYGSDVLCISYLIQILLLINQSFGENSDLHTEVSTHKVQPIMNYIDHHLTEDLSLETIADALALDKYYLSHLFKRETESTVFQYILVKRVALAKELLNGGSTVTEACQQSGFHDYSNFIRTFRKTTGFSPGQFKKGGR